MLNKVYDKIKRFIKENTLFLCGIAIILFLFFCPTPYVIYAPGGVVSLENRIELDNAHVGKGSFNMAYVTMIKGNIPFILLSKILPNWDLVKNENIAVNGNVEEMIKSDQISMQESINAAVYKAYTLAKKHVEIKKEIHHITYIDTQAKTDLQLFDEVKSVEGIEISNIDDLKAIVKEKNIGDTVNINVNRNGKEINCSAKVFASDDGPKIGLAFITTYELDTDPLIKVKTKASESGPSGGLMMALNIYNQLIEEDITKGLKIVGTGTIDFEGNVGAIGGVKYKILGAAKAKADIFLVPEENYEEAIQVKKDNHIELKIVSVKTLEEAIAALR